MVRHDWVSRPGQHMRIGELREWHTVHARCGRCAHTGVVGRSYLRRLDVGVTISQLAPFLTCTECRSVSPYSAVWVHGAER